MTDPEQISEDAGLAVLLAARARAASDGRLVLDVLLGLAAASAALTWRPWGWVLLLSAGSCFLAYGAWGISDRVLREQPASDGTTMMLRAARAMAVLVGAIGALTLLLGLCTMALGTWVS